MRTLRRCEREDTMGIFNDADQHPFAELDGDVVVEEVRGGQPSQARRDERRQDEYVLPTYVRDEAA